jgi:hypothetical protein
MSIAIKTQHLVDLMIQQGESPASICLMMARHYLRQAQLTDLSTKEGQDSYKRMKEIEKVCLEARDDFHKVNL